MYSTTISLSPEPPSVLFTVKVMGSESELGKYCRDPSRTITQITDAPTRQRLGINRVLTHTTHQIMQRGEGVVLQLENDIKMSSRLWPSLVFLIEAQGISCLIIKGAIEY